MLSPSLLIDSPRIQVVGDIVLDRYTWGAVDRISPEAPVPVLRGDCSKDRLGGAAGVAAMVSAYGGVTTLLGVIGHDEAGDALLSLMQEEGLDAAGVHRDPSRRTTVKERFLGGPSGCLEESSQLLRVDREDSHAISSRYIQSIVETLQKSHPTTDAILVSDYQKGVCRAELLRPLIAKASSDGVPIFIDPVKNCDWDFYRNTTILTPNRSEAEWFTGQNIDSYRDAYQAGHQICSRLQVEKTLITLDCAGMVLVARDGTQEAYPSTASKVCDATGAGDTVLATIGFLIAAGWSTDRAIRSANHAAGVQVEQHGVSMPDMTKLHLSAEMNTAVDDAVPLEPKEISASRMGQLAKQCRMRGQRVVFTNGCFDLLHVGHVSTLRQASKLGDVLVVALNSDSSIRSLKGSGRPVVGQEERVRMLEALEFIDYVVVYDEKTPHSLLETIRPDVLVKGGTYSPEEIVGREVVFGYGGKVCTTDRVDGVSTTKIIERAVEQRLSTTGVQ